MKTHGLNEDEKTNTVSRPSNVPISGSIFNHSRESKRLIIANSRDLGAIVNAMRMLCRSASMPAIETNATSVFEKPVNNLWEHAVAAA